MSATIRCVYPTATPQFPATDQHPSAVRYTVASAFLGRDVLVDAVGGQPTTEQVDAVLNPPVPTKTPAEKLAASGLTVDELKQLLGLP